VLALLLVWQVVFVVFLFKDIDKSYTEDVSNQFAISVQKESLWQLQNSVIEFNKGKISSMVLFNESYNDSISNTIKNIRLIQDSLYTYIKEGIVPRISLEKLDSIFKKESKDIYSYYYFTVTDSLGKQIDFLSHNAPKAIFELPLHKETIQLRNIAPEYIILNVSYHNKLSFGYAMTFLILVGLIIIILFIGYSLIQQIKIINRQEILAKQRQDFTHSLVHDLKNPVTSIITGISALKSGKLDDKPEMKEHFYSIITQESNRIHQLVNKVLEVANLENGSAVLSKTSVNLSDLLNGLTDKYQTNTVQPVHFHIELNGVETIYADRHYIYEAFDNLIENAIKYSKENEDAYITITGIQNGNETLLSFKDLGIGISEKDQKKIFQKFERSMAVISSKNKISGFGLGLNFVYQVIKAHGGTIKVNSQLGSYSEFIINLPNNENDSEA